ncbi:hypothetical protein C0033_16015 [Clostridium sp. chh4-2]|uniref:GH92 family glycosyl hydrolase n=1 Tax=Clostridium sp. chh4-2 TaxID=2067550 RepID=UPI000CCF187D|nr:GH92 family glycosyl hydrolase [Clostridium sp. chh4-2]PNV60951.1 hypothetical protein C0033_16015 [Clostridium sp. chh4-2]
MKDYKEYEHAAFADPFMGVDRKGNFFSGPYLPYGVVRMGADMIYPQSTGGYTTGRPVKCFSHTHIGGSGGGGRYGNVGITPYIGEPTAHAPYMELELEEAHAGYYHAVTRNNIEIELTATHHVGCHRYLFPQTGSSNIMIDAGSVIQTAGKLPGESMPGRGHIGIDGTGASVGGFVEHFSDTEIIGRGDFVGGWGHQFPYSVYFAVKFDAPMEKCMLGNNRGIYPMRSVYGENCFATVLFERNDICFSVGISFVSIANARNYITEEASRPFDDIHEEALNVWEKSLQRIHVDGGSEEQKELFYSLFARLLAGPSDLGTDQEFPGWKSGVRHFNDYYCLWDSVRNANSLITLFDPELERDMLNCLLDIADKTGWLPDAWIAGHSAMIQGGSSADVLFSEAKRKGIEGIDYEKALRFMRKNHEEKSPDTWLYGRFTEDYDQLGYLSTDVPRNCVSKHLEYTYQDWCIGKLAQALGHDEIWEKYEKESEKIWNLWRDDLKCFAPKNQDGSWVEPFDPKRYYHSHHSFDPYFYEAYSLCWSFHAWQDFPELVRRHGGNEAFTEHLDRFFDEGHYRSKEIMLHVPWLYLFAGRPDKACERVRECMEKYFSPGRKGLSDNEDMGCQSAFYMCAAMGLYPLMGQTRYLLCAPVFDLTVIRLGNSGKELRIEVKNKAEGKKYIAGAWINGQDLSRPWVEHDEIAGGGVITFELSERPGNFWRNGYEF